MIPALFVTLQKLLVLLIWLLIPGPMHVEVGGSVDVTVDSSAVSPVEVASSVDVTVDAGTT